VALPKRILGPGQVFWANKNVDDPKLFSNSHINALQRISALKAAELDYARLCGRRRTVITKPFSFWGEPKPREPSHVYDLRSYVLKVVKL
jgi:hypothetical protein